MSALPIDAAREDAASKPGLTSGGVSAPLGPPAPAVRSEERPPELSTGAGDGHADRRHRKDDVAAVRLARDLRAAEPGTASDLVASTGASPSALAQQLLAAIAVLNTNDVPAVLDASVHAHGMGVTLDEVLLPSMREVGARWSRGECDVAQERLATSSVLAWLNDREAAAPPPMQDGSVVLACGPLDQHTIALEAFSVLLRQQRFSCQTLGAQTSAASLRLVVEQCSPQAVVVVCQLSRNRRAAATALDGAGGSGAALFYAGAAFRTAASRKKMPGHYLGGNLSRAATYMTTQLRPG